MTSSKRKLLFLYPQSLGPEPDRQRNSHFHLSSSFSGDLIYDWVRGPSDRGRFLPPIQAAIGDFTFHFDDNWALRERFGGARAYQFYLAKGRELITTKGPYDAIVAYGPFRTGMAALRLGARHKTPVVVEIPGNHLRSYEFVGGRLAPLKKRLARPFLSHVARNADLLRMLYPTQLDDVGRPDPERTAVFHDFVPVGDISWERPREKFVFFLGYPFHLKGVDLLIRAFRAVADRHPEWRLLIMGHCPDPSAYHALAGGDPRIEITRAVEHPKAMAVMERCGVFVLPSRTEAMGRVLLEAMAARRPIIASRVDGIPTYVEHDANGLLFSCGDANDLAAKLDRVLGDEAVAERLANEGLERVHQRYSVGEYVEHFAEMIERVVRLPRRRG